MCNKVEFMNKVRYVADTLEICVFVVIEGASFYRNDIAIDNEKPLHCDSINYLKQSYEEYESKTRSGFTHSWEDSNIRKPHSYLTKNRTIQNICKKYKVESDSLSTEEKSKIYMKEIIELGETYKIPVFIATIAGSEVYLPNDCEIINSMMKEYVKWQQK